MFLLATRYKLSLGCSEVLWSPGTCTNTQSHSLKHGLRCLPHAMVIMQSCLLGADDLPESERAAFIQNFYLAEEVQPLAPGASLVHQELTLHSSTHLPLARTCSAACCCTVMRVVHKRPVSCHLPASSSGCSEVNPTSAPQALHAAPYS